VAPDTDISPTSPYFGDLSYTSVEELRASEQTVVLLLPVGATEPHGPHAPLSTDPIISLGMCERAAAHLADDPEVRALILPTLPYGVTRYASAFPGVVHVNEESLRAMVVDICVSLSGQGFSHVVIVNNHFEPEHVRTLHAAADELKTTHGIAVGYLDLTRRERAKRLTSEFQRGESHADRYETSLVLAARPELVDRETMADLPRVAVNMATAIAEGKMDFLEIGLTRAYAGSPAEATAEEGEAIFETLSEMLVEVIRELAAGTGGRDTSGMFGRV